MNQENPITAEIVRTKKVYSAPRRFDLATLFVVMIVYSCLLGLFVGLGVPDFVTFSILIFLTVVAISQPVMFGGNRPRLSSVIVGGIAMPLFIASVTILNEHAFSPVEFLIVVLGGLMCSIPMGISAGYLAGTMVGGVFLIADWLRQGRGRVD